MSMDSGLGECTPKRVQKRLFSQNVSCSKKNLFQTEKFTKRNGESSGEESDLGPMSPLQRSDNSGSESSPGRQYDSPFTTPDNSPQVKYLTWDRLRVSSNLKKSGLSPFSSLKRITKEARSTPRRRIFSNSPKSNPITPNKKNPDQENFIPSTPKQTGLEMNDDIVPETPQKSETPQKDNFSERRLITPLGSVCKQIVIPPLHRRKSICTTESTEESSPEPRDNSNKRHANEFLHHTGTKISKIDDDYFIPKARASLFQEDKNKSPQFAPLSTKSFYKNNNSDRRVSFGFGWKAVGNEKERKKRHSLPSKPHRHSTGSTKRSKFGLINAGVKHGIKRPKPKRQNQNESFEKKYKPPNDNSSINNQSNNELKENDIPMETSNILNPSSYSSKAKETQPIVADPNKKFFKYKRTTELSHQANITVNDKIKLKVSGGKIIRQQKKDQVKEPASKKPKLDPVVFDTTDLNVDDQDLKDTVNDKDVANLLKILEDDWADDDYDIMEPVTITITRSPLKAASLKNDSIPMSPASVLSTMTSSMNIEDQNSLKNFTNKLESIESQENSNKVDDENSKKLFPIFDKGYSSNLSTSENIEKKGNRGIKRSHAWQLSVKTNGDSTQYQLDVGQKRFGTIQCSECNVIYQIGEPEDENAHLVFHNNVRKLRFNGWKNEHVVYENPFTRSRVITVEPTDPKHWWNKVDEILTIVDQDLGLDNINLTDHQGKRVYLYIQDKNIIGILVAESIKTAHRMIPELFDLNCCEEDETTAKCGVYVIWAALSHRKRGIARKLMDILRSHFYYGYIMSIDDIAFSIPTPSGRIFAEKYVGNRRFKVYS
ncbi:N-acetyltransferase ESCO2 [Chelonus insularis]|uniref:N-acetyltransferase ESCO2 n=1 Tax=Chelonus insularis TaxID=460826 RepID=UPI00158B1EE4|nr:N-acetyltransferase ESCO2 [Chelonus insularis]